MDPFIGGVAIAIGVAMIAQWALALVEGQRAGTRDAADRDPLAPAAEFSTAAVLVAGGAVMIAGASIAAPVTLYGFGMLTYTAVVSPGYFLDRGERGPVAMFAVIILVALLAAAILIAELAG